jgi:hypothetical protein
MTPVTNAYEALATLLEQKGDEPQASGVEQLIGKDESDLAIKSLVDYVWSKDPHGTRCLAVELLCWTNSAKRY